MRMKTNVALSELIWLCNLRKLNIRYITHTHGTNQFGANEFKIPFSLFDRANNNQYLISDYYRFVLQNCRLNCSAYLSIIFYQSHTLIWRVSINSFSFSTNQSMKRVRERDLCRDRARATALKSNHRYNELQDLFGLYLIFLFLSFGCSLMSE